MKTISTSQFYRDYVGSKNVDEPMILTYYEKPMCYLYPVDMQVKGVLSSVNESGEAVAQPVFDAAAEEDSVVDERFATHTGQCQVCFDFGPIKYAEVVGDHGLKMRWMCQRCYEKNPKNRTGFGARDMVTQQKGSTFRG